MGKGRRIAASLSIAFVITILFSAGNNYASAHPNNNDAIPSSHSGYVYGTLDVDCNNPTWTTWDGQSLGGDTDGDTLCDAWETGAGLVINFKAPAGSPSPNNQFFYKYECDPVCPSPLIRDVYVELDWMRDTTTDSDTSQGSHVPLSGVIDDVKTAFSNAPQKTFGGVSAGINLHVQLGEAQSNPDPLRRGEIPFHHGDLRTPGTTQIPGFYQVKENYFGNQTERGCTGNPTPPPGFETESCSDYLSPAIKDRLTAKRQAFHYSLIIHKQYGNSFSGWAEVQGNDFVISLGTFTPMMGNLDMQKGTLMHETGHNLGLRHGGNQDYQCKPNYLSIMNYLFQFAANADIDRPLDFSQKQLNDLSEPVPTGLDERTPAIRSISPNTDPYTYPSGEMRKIYYSSPSGSMIQDWVNQGVNWDQDANVDSEWGYAQNVNNISTIPGCVNTVNSQLTGWDDWSNINFNIFGSNYFATGIASDDTSEADMVSPSDGPIAQPEDEMMVPFNIPSTIMAITMDADGNVAVDINKTKSENNGECSECIQKTQESLRKYSTNMEISSVDVMAFYNQHLVQIGNKIDSLKASDFKNGESDRMKLDQYVLTAMEFNQKDDLANVSNQLNQLRIKADELITDYVKQDVLSLIGDKIKSFEIAQDCGDRPCYTQEQKPDMSSITDLTNKVEQLAKNVKDLAQGNVGLHETLNLFWYLIIGLVIAIIVLAVGLAYRGRKTGEFSSVQSQQ